MQPRTPSCLQPPSASLVHLEQRRTARRRVERASVAYDSARSGLAHEARTPAQGKGRDAIAAERVDNGALHGLRCTARGQEHPAAESVPHSQPRDDFNAAVHRLPPAASRG
jgi:hypothetical protein